jgi:predicted transcriptional regulator
VGRSRIKRGVLEQRVLELLWEHGEASVREVARRLGDDHAYTTVMTVLDRLHNKGSVVRRKEGLAWRYAAAAPKAEVLGQKVASLLSEGGEDTEPLLSAFLDRAEAIDPEVLEKLERLIERRRRGK